MFFSNNCRWKLRIVGNKKWSHGPEKVEKPWHTERERWQCNILNLVGFIQASIFAPRWPLQAKVTFWCRMRFRDLHLDCLVPTYHILFNVTFSFIVGGAFSSPSRPDPPFFIRGLVVATERAPCFKCLVSPLLCLQWNLTHLTRCRRTALLLQSDGSKLIQAKKTHTCEHRDRKVGSCL